MKFTVILLAVLEASGCATIAGTGAAINDTLPADSEWALCKAVSVGSWLRAYGLDSKRAEAWRVLCGSPVNETPAK